MDEKLAKAIADLQKSGELTLGNADQQSDVEEYISTQCPMLNYIIGRPGVPVGRVTTIYGKEGTGKTTLGLHILAETQRLGGTAVLIDAERRHWRQRSIDLGVDMDELLQFQGETLEANFDLILKFLNSVIEAKVDSRITILYDSIAGSVTKTDLEDKDEKPAKYAKPVRAFLREVSPLLQRTSTTLVLINHVIANLQFGFFPGAGGGETMPAVHPLGFFSSLRIALRQVETLGPKENPTGVQVRAFIEDSRISPPKKKGEFKLDFATGIDYADSALDVAVAIGLVEEAKGWFKYDAISPFRRSAFAEVLSEHPEIRQQVESAPLLWTVGA